MGNCQQKLQTSFTDNLQSSIPTGKRDKRNMHQQNILGQQVDQTPLKKWLEKNNLHSFHTNCLSQKTNDFENKTVHTSTIKKSKFIGNSSYSKFKTAQIDSQFPQIQAEKRARANTYQPIQISIDIFIKVKKAKLSEFYNIICKIGEGSFGNVYKGMCKLTGEFRAIKTLKSQYMKSGQKTQLIAEMNILKRLDHPNIIKLYQIIQSKNMFYIIMEYCEGGQVFKVLSRQSDYNEQVIASIMKQLLSATFYMHQKNIIHRDLKLQNMVFQKFIDFSLQNYSEIKLKIIDFGLAINIRDYRRKKQLQVAGSLPYMSPQGRIGKICTESDIWSCGIIFCILLTGQNPLIVDQQIPEDIDLQGFFEDKIWENISQGAKDLAQLMLKINPTQRISAQQALKHRWLAYFSSVQNTKIPLQHSKSVLKNLSDYQRGDNFVAMIHSFLAFKRITQQQRQQLAELFQKFDKNGNGTIDYEQLIECYISIFGQQSSNEAEQILKEVDSNNSGQIDFSQFTRALYNKKKLFKLEALRQAFNYYDKNHSGYLEKKQLKELLDGTTSKQVTDVFLLIDVDADNKISFEQFVNYLQKN